MIIVKMYLFKVKKLIQMKIDYEIWDIKIFIKTCLKYGKYDKILLELDYTERRALRILSAPG